jgi:hypothetical protein
MSRPSLLRRERHLFPLFAVSVDRGRISGRWTAYAKPTDDVDAPWVQVTRQQLLDLHRAPTPELVSAILTEAGQRALTAEAVA